MTQSPTNAGAPAKRTWPKPYLLQLYAAAVAQGCVQVHPISAADSKSLIQTFYRLRRRVDRETRTFILPEYQLVTASGWTDELGGSIYFVFNRAPDGEPELPQITGADPAMIPSYALTTNPTPQPHLNPALEGLELEVEDINIDDYLTALRSEAAKAPDNA